MEVDNMEKDILNILNEKKETLENDNDKKFAELLTEIDNLEEERFKSDKYKNEVATILKNE